MYYLCSKHLVIILDDAGSRLVLPLYGGRTPDKDSVFHMFQDLWTNYCLSTKCEICGLCTESAVLTGQVGLRDGDKLLRNTKVDNFPGITIKTKLIVKKMSRFLKWHIIHISEITTNKV